MPRVQVAVLGDLVLDEYVFGRSDRISREAPVVIVRELRREQVLGGAANVAAGVLALGARCEPVGVVGDDPPGEAIAELLAARGARGRGLVRVRGWTTEIKTRILAGGASTTPQQILRLDRGHGGGLPKEAERRLLQALRRAASAADVLVVSDYGLGTLGSALVRTVRRLAAERPVLVDSRFHLGGWHGATWAKPNLPELEALLGVSVDGAADAARAARQLKNRLGLRGVLLTRGHQGMTLVDGRRRPLHLPVFGPGEAVDVTGAGDTVMATFAAALAAGASPEAAARLANVAGGLAVLKPGTATVSAEELREAVETGRVP
ncbi:MAG: sugar kinase [Deltaproteobacteria bacterium]|nr:MAG: sugar kinase [Deltaproteobacteria bacterium]